MAKRRLKVFVLLVLGAVLAQFLLGAFLESRVRARVVRLQARNVPTECAQLNEANVSAADNGAPFYEAACALCQPFEVHYKLDELSTTQGDSQNFDLTSWKDQIAGQAPALKQFEFTMTLVQEGNSRPGSQLLQHKDGWQMTVPALLNLSKWACIAACNDIEEGKSQEAVARLLPYLQMLVRLQPELTKTPWAYNLLIRSQEWALRPLERLAARKVKVDYREVLPLLAASLKLHENGPQLALNGMRVLDLDAFERIRSGQRDVTMKSAPWLYSLAGNNLVLLDELALLRCIDREEQELLAGKSITNSRLELPFYAWISYQMAPSLYVDDFVKRPHEDITKRLKELDIQLR